MLIPEDDMAGNPDGAQESIIEDTLAMYVRDRSAATFTADLVIEMANETSDSLGNLYRLDFIDRVRHEADRLAQPADEGAPR